MAGSSPNLLVVERERHLLPVPEHRLHTVGPRAVGHPVGDRAHAGAGGSVIRSQVLHPDVHDASLVIHHELDRDGAAADRISLLLDDDALPLDLHRIDHPLEVGAEIAPARVDGRRTDVGGAELIFREGRRAGLNRLDQLRTGLRATRVSLRTQLAGD